MGRFPPFLVFVVLFPLAALGQSPLQKAKQALIQKDATAFVQQAHSTLNLRILSQEGVFSQAQAGQLIQAFMKEYAPATVEISQIQEQKGKAHFFIGEWKTPQQKFRIYVLFKVVNGVERVHSFEVQANE